MEMVEEEQNQQITENLGEDVDRISALPEGLLLEILSRLPYTKEAIKTGTLSKRWEHLWKLAPCLLFDEDEFIYLPTDYVTTVDKTLSQCRQLKLKKFHAHIFYHTEYQSRCKNWLQFAVDCNVEELHINCGGGVEFVLDQYIFTSSCFTDLKLATCVINPTGPISWKNLTSLSISIVKLDEDLIEKMLSGSPLLETLELIDCDGYKRLNVTSKSVKNLVFSSYTDPCVPSTTDFVEIIAPNILSLTIQDYLDLSKLLLLNVSSLVAANLDYRCKYGTKRAEEEEMLKGFIKNLSHVKELKIGVSCSRVLSRLEAKGFDIPSNLRRKS